MRKPLGPGLKLAITLRYLATGNSYKTLEYGFRVTYNTISLLVPETCEAIFDELGGEYMQCPSTPDEWKLIAEGFSKRWNFHNCLGALDGKHVAIRAPSGAGSVFFNYKGFHSVVLMAIVDSDYRFIYADVGANGRCSDGGVFLDTPLRSAIEDGDAGLPHASPLPHDDQPVPYAFVGDDALPFKTWLMKPFPQRGMANSERLFNYRLSRARRVVENAFGILSHRFRFLLTTMQQKPVTVQSIVLGACVLHNIMRTRYPRHTNSLIDREDPLTHAVTPGAWLDDDVMVSLNHMRGHNMTRAAKGQRDFLRDYYCGPGKVPWQDRMI